MTARRSLSALLSASLLAATLAACGGAQSGPTAIYRLAEADTELTSALELVPSDALYFFGMDFTDRDAEEFTAAMGAAANEIGELSSELFGVDLSTSEGFAEVGIDPRGEIAVFSTTGSPVAVFRLSDPDAFRAKVDEVAAEHADHHVGTFQLAGTEFTTVGNDEVSVDIATSAGFAVVRGRVHADDADLHGVNVSDDAFAAILTGDIGATLSSNPNVRNLMARADGAIVQLAYVDVAGLSNAFDAVLASQSSAADPISPACAEATARATAAVPWFGLTSWDAGDVRHTEQVLALGDDARDNARSVVGSALDVRPFAADATVFVSLDLDFLRLADLATDDASLAECENLAGLIGMVGQGRERVSDALSQARAFADGSFALALFGVDVAGFIPRADVLWMLGTPDPVRVADSVGALIEGRGGSGEVDPTAAYPQIDYNLLGYQLRLVQLEDRVVGTIGDVPESASNALVAAEHERGEVFLVSTVDFVRLSAMIGEIRARVESMGVAQAQLDVLDQLAHQFERFVYGEATAEVTNDGVVVRTATQYAGAAE